MMTRHRVAIVNDVLAFLEREFSGMPAPAMSTLVEAAVILHKREALDKTKESLMENLSHVVDALWGLVADSPEPSGTSN